MERELIAKVEGHGVDNDAGAILVYRFGDKVSLVATAEKNGDAEIILSKAAAMALSDALKKVS
jgi:alpha-D-ribose 1-methylphosphonate 5-phosphate C-P lyase